MGDSEHVVFDSPYKQNFGDGWNVEPHCTGSLLADPAHRLGITWEMVLVHPVEVNYGVMSPSARHHGNFEDASGGAETGSLCQWEP